MTFRRIFLVFSSLALALLVSLGALSSGGMLSGLQQQQPDPHPASPPPFPDAYKLAEQPREAGVPVAQAPSHLTHPCGGMYAEPPFAGLSPIAIAYPYINCPSTSMMGDVATWQYNGHDYVGLSGFGYRGFFLYKVDDPYNPELLFNMALPSGATASTSIFDWKQNGNQYLSYTTRASGSTGCGFWIYNVNDPTAPQLVRPAVQAYPDWCTVHEHFVSLDDAGNADYAWLTMSSEAGSENKIVAMDIRDLNNIHEVNRWERGDGTFIHDSNVVRGKLYTGHWDGGMQVFDKAAFVSGSPPTPLNPINSIRPSSFWVHHTVPTSDDRYALIQDEFLNGATLGKVKLYNIENLGAPQFVADITGGDPVANVSQAHNMIIKPLSAGVDLLLNAWYKAGIRGFKIETNVTPPTITQVFRHQLSQSAGSGFGNVWGVDWLPCTLRGVATTCLYAGDMKYGLIVNAVDTGTFQPNPALDPYTPEAVITSPTAGQQIDACTFTITGTGHDYWSGLQRIEVSTDDGATWNEATGTTTWSYEWTIPAGGAYNIKVRAIDLANNAFTSNAVAVNVTANCGGGATNTPVPATSTPEPPTSTPVLPTNTVAVPTATSVEATATSPAATETPGAPTATPTVCDIEFNDVPPSSTFYAYIHCLACQGIVQGYPDGTFRPFNNVTRGQIAKIVSESAGLDDVVPETQQSFEDVVPGSTFWLWIERLAMHDVMSGYVCGGPGEPCGGGNLPYFRPGNNATRGQILKIISNAAGYDDDIPPDQQTFEDVPPGSTFWLYVERFVLHNPLGIQGYPCGGVGEPCGPENRPYLRPNASVTRGQISKIDVFAFFPECNPER